MNDEQRHDELDRKLDAALDALNTGQAPEDTADEELAELLDTARLARRLREPEWPADDFATLLAGRLAVQLTSPGTLVTENNHHSVEALPPTSLRPRPRRLLLALLAALVRTVGAVVIAGMLAGMLAGGVGGRLAMRASGAIYEREHPGEPFTTQSSQTPVGEISLDGTVSLLFEGMFAGIAGGALYLGVRRWLPGRGRRQGVVFGLFGLLLAGTAFITSDNQDFAQIGNPALNIAMFAAIFVFFGVLIVPLAGRLERFAAPFAGAAVWRRVVRWPLLLVGGLVVALFLPQLPIFFILWTIEIVRSLSDEFAVQDSLTAAVAVLLICLAMLTALAAPSVRVTLSQLPWRTARRLLVDEHRLQIAGRTVLALATLLGVLLVGSEVVAILTAG